VVALAAAFSRAREQTTAWIGAALAVLLVGTLVRLLVRPVDVAAVSAALLAALLWLGLWLVALLLSTPRTAFVVGLVAMLVLDLAAVSPRTLVPYDQVEALSNTDQKLTLAVPAGSTQLVLMVEPVFEGAQPRFQLVGWSCPWQRGRQYVALPLTPGTSSVDLRLSGAPDREREYLVVYWSSRGFMSGEPAAVCSKV
jgi:hypothetical protein